MKVVVFTLSTAVLIASVFAHAAAGKTPGHEMQKHGKKAGYHTSSYGPVHRTQANRSNAGYPGASGYAPTPTRDITDIVTQGGGGGGGGGY